MKFLSQKEIDSACEEIERIVLITSAFSHAKIGCDL